MGGRRAQWENEDRERHVDNINKGIELIVIVI